MTTPEVPHENDVVEVPDRDESAASAAPAGAARGTLRLHADSCTSCMLCVRECPAWCIKLRADKTATDAGADGRGRKERTALMLREFDVDYSLCIYCGICVDVCPFDCLSWDSESTPAALQPESLVHGLDRLAAPGTEAESVSGSS